MRNSLFIFRSTLTKKQEVMEKNLEDVRRQMIIEFDWMYNCEIYNNKIVVEEEYYADDDERNDNNCYDQGVDSANLIFEKFPMLELDEYECYRHKYSVITLKLKETLTKK